MRRPWRRAYGHPHFWMLARCLVGCYLFRLKGQFFYRMVPRVLPQWIRTYPEDAAPRTGEGLFPGEIIEVDQVLYCALLLLPLS